MSVVFEYLFVRAISPHRRVNFPPGCHIRPDFRVLSNWGIPNGCRWRFEPCRYRHAYRTGRCIARQVITGQETFHRRCKVSSPDRRPDNQRVVLVHILHLCFQLGTVIVLQLSRCDLRHLFISIWIGNDHFHSSTMSPPIRSWIWLATVRVLPPHENRRSGSFPHPWNGSSCSIAAGSSLLHDGRQQ